MCAYVDSETDSRYMPEALFGDSQGEGDDATTDISQPMHVLLAVCFSHPRILSHFACMKTLARARKHEGQLRGFLLAWLGVNQVHILSRGIIPAAA
jgi:hypothetical protein